ncbi:Dabb family protein [Pontibacter korlensis]|uniref:Stress protein n=1 Tax=Pontibacter korlensis TaxID=400092 RepID=A0A0E3ZCV8_9BACT|nr:Dabb family protein [Pontibacter korlensis]AKD01890.1 stress protein [Pontibacter korlensis]
MKKLSRRSFLGNSTFLSFAGALGLMPLFASAQKKPKGNFVHHVYFWLNNPDSEEDKAKLIEGLNTLKGIKEIKLARIGVPASTNREVIERSYAVSWLLFFDNLEEEEVYQKHPVHLKFVENYSHLWSKVIVYDSVDV